MGLVFTAVGLGFAELVFVAVLLAFWLWMLETFLSNCLLFSAVAHGITSENCDHKNQS